MSFDFAKRVEGSERLIEIFGSWPSFHDAEIVSLRLDRGDGRPTLDVQVHVFERTSEVNSRGYYVTRRHTLATIRFDDVDLVAISDFNFQNVVDDIEVSPDQDSQLIQVYWPGINGVEMRFKCMRISVLDAVPFVSENEATRPTP